MTRDALFKSPLPSDSDGPHEDETIRSYGRVLLAAARDDNNPVQRSTMQGRRLDEKFIW